MRASRTTALSHRIFSSELIVYELESMGCLAMRVVRATRRTVTVKVAGLDTGLNKDQAQLGSSPGIEVAKQEEYLGINETRYLPKWISLNVRSAVVCLLPYRSYVTLRQ